jgi:hypothetical protein
MVLELAAHTWYSKRTLPEAATSTNSTAQTTLDQNVEENRELTLEQGTNVDQKNHKNTDFQKGPTQYHQHGYEKLKFFAKSYWSKFSRL